MFLLLVVAVVCVAWYLSYIVTDPSHMLIALGGDSGMTYHAYLYHVLYEKGTWTTCMNYPYGDNITYKGALPMLSLPLSYIKDVIPISIETALAIMHLAIALSYVLGIVYTYKILSFFNVRPLIAAIFSCLLILLSPQVFRLLGHFGLTYVCVIPMTFYWTLRYYHSNHSKYALYLFLLGTIVSFSHLYFGAIIFAWVVFYSVGYSIFVSGSLGVKLKHSAVILSSMLGMFLVLKSFMILTDPVKDRPKFQSDAARHITYKTQLITSARSPFWEMMQKNKLWTGDVSADNDEGYAYLGLAAIFIVSVSLLTGIVLIFKRRDRLLVGEQKFQPVWLFIACCALLLGMDVPYRLGMASLFEYTGTFKQFRALGRFSWIFYYVIVVYAVVVLNNWYARLSASGRSFIGYALVIIAVVIWGVEVKGYADLIRERNSHGPDQYNFFFSRHEKGWKQYLQERGLQASDFQGMILLPFANEGTEKLAVSNDQTSWLMTLAGAAAIELHLPIVDAFIARASWSQAEAQVRLVAGPYADKPLLHMGNGRPYLLLHFEENQLDKDTRYLLSAADSVGKFNQCNIYVFHPERLLEHDKKCADTVNAIIPHMHGMDTCLGSKGTWYVDHYDNGTAKDKLFGTGAMWHILGPDSLVASIMVTPEVKEELYEFSAWFLLSRDDPFFPGVGIETWDSTDHIIYTKELLTKLSVDNHGLWFRASMYFNLPPNCAKVRMKIRNLPPPTYIAMDEFMLRPANSLIISKAKDGSIMVNNHLFRSAGQ